MTYENLITGNLIRILVEMEKYMDINCVGRIVHIRTLLVLIWMFLLTSKCEKSIFSIGIYANY